MTEVGGRIGSGHYVYAVNHPQRDQKISTIFAKTMKSSCAHHTDGRTNPSSPETGFNPDGFEELPLGIVDVNRASIGPRGPSCMTGGISR
jgi:hypothetical protein